MGISAVRGSTYTPPPAPKIQRADTQRALELHQQNRPKEVARRPPSTHVAAAEQRRDVAPQKEKGSRVDVRA
jgi:hypothetical protein